MNRPSILLRSLRAAAGSAAYAAIGFIGAGHLDWARGWLYAAVFVGASVVGSLIVQRTNPALLEVRARGIRPDTKPFDRIFYLFFVPLILIYPLLAGMDAVRFSWSPLPWWTIYPGLLLFLIGSAITTWTMVVNAFAETSVRIQEERGHAVVIHGPYRIVRHPMYAGTIIGLPSGALILGSAWALLPACLVVLLFVWRTAREDHTLRRELSGYEDYAKITRWRLLPQVW